ncbi:peptidoglycan DD-metalloendopeptidase family protein [Marinomonas communis]|uniref:peptidoglycan DD-metalloendopeptidase family protein n=1 Tax=Marinomonas communis TaxID=28254 RepID=UPI002B1CD9E4|nr:peptidoglycan DD-metalloendopeptidase family protein [Marinomonas communis]
MQSGDTLFSIAFSYGLDYRNVANINGIDSPYIIYPNQKIRLRGAPKSTRIVSSTRASASVSTPVKPVTKNSTEKVNSSSRSVSTVNIPDQKVSAWRWPISGSVTKSFSNAGVSSKGIDIKGKDSEHVKAAADGVVVYAGNGLIGYGNLVIVKHNDVYLSAYAYNDRILVKEKQSVRVGDSLAIIGGKGSERPLLHFEVRRDGQPIDPLKVLPKQ